MVEAVSKPAVPAEGPGRPGRLEHLTLTAQFLIAGSIVLFIGMLAIGFWVTAKIEDGVTRNTAASTALYMESFVAPRVQELATGNKLSSETRRALDNILHNSEIGRRVVSFKIWKEGGLIAYSSRPSMIGRRFPVTAKLQGAWGGNVTAEFDVLGEEEDTVEGAGNQPLLEMYSPIRERETGRIIAVAEFYETAHALRQNLFQAKLQSWLAVGGTTLVMLAALSGIVVRGSRTIERQRALLQGRVEELSVLLAQNEGLRDRLQVSSHRTAEFNERYLRRLGADLHDGPAQLIGFALLRIDSLRQLFSKGRSNEDGTRESREIGVIHDALREAIDDIREICAGLTLAKLDEMSPIMILRQIVGAHERRTRTKVTLAADSLPASFPMPVKIALFRFVQEGLNNAYRHAGGTDQTVACRYDGEELELEVADRGPGFSPEAISGENGGLGLAGLRERMESLGGTLQINSDPGSGTRLVMRCRI